MKGNHYANLMFVRYAVMTKINFNRVSLKQNIWIKLYTSVKLQNLVIQANTVRQSFNLTTHNGQKWKKYILKIIGILQYLNWQLGLQLHYRKITISFIINVELQTFIVNALLYYHSCTTKRNYTHFRRTFKI